MVFLFLGNFIFIMFLGSRGRMLGVLISALGDCLHNFIRQLLNIVCVNQKLTFYCTQRTWRLFASDLFPPFNLINQTPHILIPFPLLFS